MANINWDFIKEKEGGSQNNGYVPEGGDNSGVTIGSGFDLGQQTEETIKNFGFKDQNILNIIRPYLGIQGAKAKDIAPNLTLSDEQKFDVDSSVKNYYENNIINQYNSKKRKFSFDELDPAVQTAIASVGYQYGDLRRTPRFFDAALNNDSESLVNELRNFNDNFSTRRNAEADYIVNNIQDINLKKNLRIITDPLNPAQADGELYMDRVFKTWQYKPEEAPSFIQGLGTAAKLNWIIPSIWRTVTAPTFEPDPNFSLINNEKEIKKILDENNIDSAYFDYFVGAVSIPHFLTLVDRVKYEQDQRAELAKMGWKGLAADVGSWFLDPVSLASGVGIVNKITGAGSYLSKVGRMERFTKAGLIVGAEQGVLTSAVAMESPSVDLNTVLISAALGGTLGGSISAIRKAQLSRVAKDVEAAELAEEGVKLTKKGEETFADLKTSKISSEDVINTSDIIDPSVVVDKDIIFPFLRNIPFFNIIPISKSSALGGSKSNLAKAFSFATLEDNIGWAYKGEGKVSQRLVSQPDTVELIKDAYLHKYLNNVSLEVRTALNDYLKEQGMTGVMGFFKRAVNITARQDFMQKVTRAIRTFDPKNTNAEDKALLSNPHIAKAANAYANAFEQWAKELKSKGIEGAEFNINRGYIPRRLSLERYEALKKKIGQDGVKDLIVMAILDRQKYMSVAKDAELKASLNVKDIKRPRVNKNLPDDQKLGADWEKKIREEELKKMAGNADAEDFISPEKADLMAQAIVNYLKNSRRQSGFDLEALLRVKDADKLKAFFQEAFPHLDDADISMMSSNLASVVKTLTSGRLTERIKLNESFEATIKNQKVRLDELYENNVDILYNDYTQEMAGWSALSDRLGIKSRDAWYETSNRIIEDIENNYNANGGFFEKIRLQEEIKTVRSVFENLMGRSAEVDPSSPWASAFRTIRRYNFVRVLNQVGISSLPELGVVISSSGIKTFAQNIPEFGNIIREMQLGKPLQSTFFKELATINFGNGDEYLYRIAHASEALDQNTAVQAMGIAAKGSNLLTAAEKVTTWTSGLTPVDTFLRKLAVRTFVDKFADDMFKLKASNFDFTTVNLNRYKVLGFTEAELKRFAKEFTDGTVTVEKTFWGTKVKQFNFANWKDEDLLSTFANRLNRHTKRAVQYNFIGDTNRFFGDETLGKTIGQFRQFVITAWSKQFLHNVALADFRTFSMFAYTSMLATMAYLGQTHFNTLGMGDRQRKEYLEKRLGKDGDYSKLGLAAFQRTGWSSLIPAYADIFTSQMAPEYRFNTRSSGLEVNLITGNPTYDLLSSGADVMGSFLKATRDNYSFSKIDARRLTRLIAFQNSFGISNILNLFIDKSPLPDEGRVRLY